MHTLQALIIGTGTAGQTAAAIVREAGLSVGIVDQVPYGGTCALRGCQPKKYLVVPAHAALEGHGLVDRGFRAAPALDWGTMQRSRAEFTDAVPASTAAGFKSAGITSFHGEAQFLDSHTVRCGEDNIRAERFLICSGARSIPLDVPGGELAHTSDDFLYQSELPLRVAFVGGGFISMEFATIAAAAGAEVTVLQRGERVLDRFDSDLVDTLQNACAARGLRIVTNAQLTGMRRSGNGLVLALADGTEIATDAVYAALGRAPNVEELGLDRAGVTYGARGIPTDASMRTNVEHIYAAGDCVTGIQLAPISDAEARVAARNIVADLRAATGDLGTEERAELHLDVLPTVVFTYPQLAQFGPSAAQARHNEAIRINTGSGAQWPSYRRLNEPHMRYKVMIDQKTDRILGAAILAPHAGELINVLALAAASGITARAFREIPWAYPTYSADLKYMLA